MKDAKKETKLVPELRFKEFEAEWTPTTISKLLKIGSGRDYKHLNRGDIPVYGTGGYMTSVDDYLYEGESVGIGRKGTINKPVYLGGKFWTVDTLFYTYDFNGVTPYFTYQIFQKINWEKYNEASGVPSLSKSTIEKIKINIPSIPEQQKIASFLIAVDKRIEQLTKKKKLLEEYKKGVMQKIFNQEIRFKDENGNDFPEWEEKRFIDVFTRITRRNKEGNNNILTISAQSGLINQEKYYSRQIASSDTSNYLLICNGEFAYNKSYSNGYPYGAIKRLDAYDKGILSSLYICFKINNNALSDFFRNYFEAGVFNKQINKIAQEGARNHGLLNMSVTELFEDTILFTPIEEEAIRISESIESLSAMFSKIESELNSTIKFKLGLLQQMFI